MSNQPLALDSMAFRRTMGLFATGVTVMLTRTEDGAPIGMTVNTLTSVSLEPLLVLVCVAKDAYIAPHVMETGQFSLSFLEEGQAALSDYFAGIYQRAEPPEFVFEEWAGGLRIARCLAAIGCAPYAIHEGGDHWIVVGEVIAMERLDDPPNPLVFYSGKYRRLADGEQDHQ